MRLLLLLVLLVQASYVVDSSTRNYDHTRRSKCPAYECYRNACAQDDKCMAESKR